MCRRALAALLSIGGSTFDRLRHGESVFTNSVRKPIQKHPLFGFALRGNVQHVWEEIIIFFYHVYHTTGEVLPDSWHMMQKGDLETPFPEDQPEAANKAEERDRLINSIGRTLNTSTTDIETQLIGPGSFSGPRRCVQHQTRTDFYFEFLAFAESRKSRTCSYSCFMKVASAVIKPGLQGSHLKFRKPGQHGQCDYCFTTRERVRAARTEAAKLEVERDLARHRLSQWQDRQVYWSFRNMSQRFFSNLLATNSELLGCV